VNQRYPEQEARQQSCHASCGPGQRRQPGPAVSVRVPLPHPLQPGLKPLPGNRQHHPHLSTSHLPCTGTGLSRFLLMALLLRSILLVIKTAMRF